MHQRSAQNHPVPEKTSYHPSSPLISPTHCTKITLYQKKPLITLRHPSYPQHTAPKSPCTRKNLLSPLVTPHITHTLHQNRPVPEKTSYHPSSPLSLSLS